jgi:integrating conjugative element protein (TIGR03752 family)
MKGNPLLKWLTIPVILLALILTVRFFSSGREERRQEDLKLTREEAAALGIAGDTPRDTVATLVGEVKNLRRELKGALDENQRHKTENDRLRQREGSIDQRIENALEGERRKLGEEREEAARERREAQGLLGDLQRRLDHMGKEGEELPIGAGPVADGTLRWLEPADAPDEQQKKAGAGFPVRFAPDADAPDEDFPEARERAAQKPTPTPVYTVPANATLTGSVAMTALIGRVPVDGTVNDPYPFKVLIGPDNLTANGIELPDVAGAVVSGTASGDWTLSCVRGKVRRVTFVFQDGTIRTVPEESKKQNGGEGGSENILDGIGWISDEHGLPCVVGERKSNAQQYLGTQALITAAGAGAASLIESETALVTNSNGSLGTVGISGNEAMGRILATGVQDMSQWVNKLYGQAFAAIYVKPGARVAVHLEEALAIDHDPQGRKVDHRIGDVHAQNLD